ncbi:MAG: hypothetical protein NTV52_00715 [Acidobacteria bacterium]|nr:hypothetical protein [Acidobacteriota bacterium]
MTSQNCTSSARQPLKAAKIALTETDEKLAATAFRQGARSAIAATRAYFEQRDTRIGEPAPSCFELTFEDIENRCQKLASETQPVGDVSEPTVRLAVAAFQAGISRLLFCLGECVKAQWNSTGGTAPISGYAFEVMGRLEGDLSDGIAPSILRNIRNEVGRNRRWIAKGDFGFAAYKALAA